MPGQFDFDMSVAKDKKRRQRGTRGMSGAFETSSRVCEHPGCSRQGKYRAPKSPDSIDEFHWFCREHVRKYNLKWDFFKEQASKSRGDDPESHPEEGDGLTEGERRRVRESVAYSRLGISDPGEILGESGTPRHHPTTGPNLRLTYSERKALDILDAKEWWGKSRIKKQYKSLVKNLHPDSNDGDRCEEDRLKEVVWAWNQIRSSRNIKA